jgi:predicted transposase YdaD
MSSAMIQTMLGGGVAVEAAADSEKEGKREGETEGRRDGGKERRRERERGRTVAKKARGAFLWVIRCTQNLVTC